jgi:hypothetical protein
VRETSCDHIYFARNGGWQVGKEGRFDSSYSSSGAATLFDVRLKKRVSVSLRDSAITPIRYRPAGLAAIVARLRSVSDPTCAPRATQSERDDVVNGRGRLEEQARAKRTSHTSVSGIFENEITVGTGLYELLYFVNSHNKMGLQLSFDPVSTMCFIPPRVVRRSQKTERAALSLDRAE